MRRKVLIAAIPLAVLACTTPTTTYQENPPPSSFTTTAIPTSSTFQLSPSIMRTQALCIEHTIVDWPLKSAINSWNANNATILKVVPSDRPCVATIVISEEPTDKYWGKTTPSVSEDVVKISVSSKVPIENRQHVLCHELGHALGVIHSSNRSCMNIQLVEPYPSQADLDEVRQTTWTMQNVRRQIHAN